jgi:hypothetical protein
MQTPFERERDVRMAQNKAALDAIVAEVEMDGLLANKGAGKAFCPQK